MKIFQILLISTILLSNNLSAQTKSETEKWITEKYNYYERPTNIKDDLFFDNDYLYYVGVSGDYYAQAIRIKLKDIEGIEIKKRRFDANDDQGWYAIQLYYQVGKTEKRDLLKENNGFLKSDFGTGFQILLSSEFSQDDMPERMTKAFVHLISLNGGKVKVQKEAF